MKEDPVLSLNVFNFFPKERKLTLNLMKDHPLLIQATRELLTNHVARGQPVVVEGKYKEVKFKHYDSTHPRPKEKNTTKWLVTYDSLDETVDCRLLFLIEYLP